MTRCPRSSFRWPGAASSGAVRRTGASAAGRGDRVYLRPGRSPEFVFTLARQSDLGLDGLELRRLDPRGRVEFGGTVSGEEAFQGVAKEPPLAGFRLSGHRSGRQQGFHFRPARGGSGANLVRGKVFHDRPFSEPIVASTNSNCSLQLESNALSRSAFS